MAHARILAPLLLLLASCATPHRDAPPTDEASLAPQARAWRDDVAALADGDGADGRRTALLRRVEAIGLQARQQPFTYRDHQGINVLADVSGPEASPLLLIGAHYDRVKVGRGATDNASGSATVLALAARLRAQPLQHHRVAIAFWDLEELGLFGSSAYIADGGRKPALYVNFDVFGWGDALWMMAPATDTPLVAASRAAATGQGLAFVAGKEYPPTDHRAFLKAGWPAVSYSLAGRREIPLILEVFAGRQPASVPKVMEVIHHDADTIEQIDAAQAARGVDAVEAALRQWDADAG